MNQQRKPDKGRGDAAFIFALVLGLAIGIFIKRIRIGLIVGLALGFLIVFTGWMRSNRN